MRGGTATFFFFFTIAFVASALSVIIVRLILRHRGEQMRHQERMAALEKGVDVPLSAPLPATSRVHLLRGLMWTFASLGIVIFLLGVSWSTQKPPYASDIAYRAHNLRSNLNIPLDEARKIAEQDVKSNNRGMPVGFALFGLVPLGVGLAYLSFYFTDESRKSADLARFEPPAGRG